MVEIMYKWKCISCGHIPQKGWHYVPATGDKIDYFYCDNCVPRGCSCQDELKDGIDDLSDAALDPNNYVSRLDEEGRKLPCIEYWFDKNEWEEEQRLPLELEEDEEPTDIKEYLKRSSK